MENNNYLKRIVSNSLDNFFSGELPFYDKVINHVIDIVMGANNVSEKDFLKIDYIKKNVTNLIKQHTYLTEFIERFKDKRHQLVAELLFDEIKNSINF